MRAAPSERGSSTNEWRVPNSGRRSPADASARVPRVPCVPCVPPAGPRARIWFCGSERRRAVGPARRLEAEPRHAAEELPPVLRPRVCPRFGSLADSVARSPPQTASDPRPPTRGARGSYSGGKERSCVSAPRRPLREPASPSSAQLLADCGSDAVVLDARDGACSAAGGSGAAFPSSGGVRGRLLWCSTLAVRCSYVCKGVGIGSRASRGLSTGEAAFAR